MFDERDPNRFLEQAYEMYQNWAVTKATAENKALREQLTGTQGQIQTRETQERVSAVRQRLESAHPQVIDAVLSDPRYQGLTLDKQKIAAWLWNEGARIYAEDPNLPDGIGVRYDAIHELLAPVVDVARHSVTKTNSVQAAVQQNKKVLNPNVPAKTVSAKGTASQGEQAKPWEDEKLSKRERQAAYDKHMHDKYYKK